MMNPKKSNPLIGRIWGAGFAAMTAWPLFSGLQVQAQVNQPPPGPAVKLDALDSMEEEKNHFSISGDYMRGSGDLALPFEYGLANDPNIPVVPARNVFGDRKASYYGGTISYSRSEEWYFDVSISQGQSDAKVDTEFKAGNDSELLSQYSFSNDDIWIQAYARYGFPSLRGKRVNAYLRFGVTYVDNDLTGAPQGFLNVPTTKYAIDAKIRDFTGNVGLGVSVTAFQSAHFRLSGVMEGEIFAGVRKEDIRERLVDQFIGDLNSGKENVDALLFGGLGRTTLRLEFFPTATSRYSFFADGGIQVRNSWVNFPKVAEVSGGGDEKLISELLWGPYARLGMRFSF